MSQHSTHNNVIDSSHFIKNIYPMIKDLICLYAYVFVCVYVAAYLHVYHYLYAGGQKKASESLVHR